jgi:hypothetical protein
MITLNAPTPKDPKVLRLLLHSQVDSLPDAALELARRFLLEIRLQEITAELDDAADDALAQGRFTPERIAAAVAEHRAAHPYRRA